MKFNEIRVKQIIEGIRKNKDIWHIRNVYILHSIHSFIDVPKYLEIEYIGKYDYSFVYPITKNDNIWEIGDCLHKTTRASSLELLDMNFKEMADAYLENKGAPPYIKTLPKSFLMSVAVVPRVSIYTYNIITTEFREKYDK